MGKKKKSQTKKIGFIKIITKGFNRLITLFKLYNPKIKEILASFNEINAEVENLVKYSAPVGEEEKKYGGKVVATVLDYITLCHRLPEDREHNDAVQLQMLANRFHNHGNHNGIFL